MNKRNFDLTNILILSICSICIALSLIFPDSPLLEAIVLSILLIGLIITDKHIGKITNTPEDSPKLKTLKFCCRFTMFILIIGIIAITLSPLDLGISQSSLDKLLVGFVSLIMMILGNKMPQIKRNWFIGLRLPWTCRDEDAWRASHKLLGYTSFPFAILQFILVFFIPVQYAVTIGLLGWVLLSSIYSLFVYIKKYKAFI